MIKSSDEQFNNSYRILRVLQNKDLLVIDTARRYYIFAQYHNNQSNLPALSAAKRKPAPNNLTHVIYYQQLIVIDGVSYLVFKMPEKQIVWAYNIDDNHLRSEDFVFLLIRQGLISILDQLLWLGTSFNDKMLSNRNFLLVNKHLYFILVPRNRKSTVSLKRNQKKRSFSSDLSVQTIMEKEQNIVRDFCLIIWQIINKQPFNRDNLEGQLDLGRTILVDLITKKTTLEAVLERIATMQSKCTSAVQLSGSSKIVFNNEIRRRSTVDNSSLLKRKYKIQPQRLHQKLLGKKMKTQVLKVPQNQTPTYTNLSYPIQREIMQKETRYKRRNLSFQIPRTQDNYITPRKIITNQMSIFNPHRSCTDKQKTYFISLLRDNKTKRYQTIQQKMETQTKVALMKFQQLRSDGKNLACFKQKEQKLKERLLEKVTKFKLDRFQKQVQTQQTNINSANLPIQSKLQQQMQIELQPIQSKLEPVQPKLQEYNSGKLVNQLSVPNIYSSESKVEAQVVLDKRQQLNKTNLKKADQPKQDQIKQLMQSNPAQVQQKQQSNNQYSNSTAKLEASQNSKISDPTPIQEFDEPSIQPPINMRQTTNIKKRQMLTLNNNQFESEIEIINLQSFKPPKQQIKQQTAYYQTPAARRPVTVSRKQTQQFQEIQTITLESRQKKQLINNRTQPSQAMNGSKKARQVDVNKRSQSQIKLEVSGNGKVDVEERLNHAKLLVDEYVSFINILGDITASAIRNKHNLAQIQWRKAAYFLYQRFYYQRTNLLIHLKAQKLEIVRKNRRVSEEQWIAWNKSEHKKRMISELEVENVKLGVTFKKYIEKLSKEDNLQEALKQFLNNWEKILKTPHNKSRIVISKYGAAIIINQYDRVKQNKLETTHSIQFLIDCVFGLRILAQLDGVSDSSQPLALSRYKDYNLSEEEIDSQVEAVYQLFYDESDGQNARN